MKASTTMKCLIACAAVVLIAIGCEARDVPAPSGAGAAQPHLFTSKDGSLLLSWMEPSASDPKLFLLKMSRFRAGKWSSPVTIASRNDFFVNWADFPSLVETADGALVAHWLQKSGPGPYAYDVMTRRSANQGKSWSRPVRLHDDGTKTEHGFVSLVPHRSGGAISALWLDGRNMKEGHDDHGNMTLRYGVLGANGQISDAAILDDRTCECCTTAMAMTSEGPVAAYRDRSADEIRDISIVRKTSKGWTKPVSLHADGWKIAGCPVNGPQMDARDRQVVVAWFTGAANKPRSYVAFSSDAGATFGSPVRIDGEGSMGRTDIELLPDGSAVATWMESAAGTAKVLARKVARDGKLGKPIEIGRSTSARNSGFPRIAISGRELYVAWTEVTETKRVRITTVPLDSL